MCGHCDYQGLLEDAGLEPTSHRVAVLKSVGDDDHPLAAHEVLDAVNQLQPINRVTVYRILDLLVDKGVLERISSGDRSFRYGLAPNSNHRPHPHFFCTRCGRMECLSPEGLGLDLEAIKANYLEPVDSVQIRLDGICRNCRKQ